MTSRRSFIENGILTTLAVVCKTPISSFLAMIKHSDGTIDWAELRKQYPIIHWDKVYFNSGSAGIVPQLVLDQYVDLIRYLAQKAPYEVWGEWQPIKKKNLQRLGGLINVSPEEIQIVRNTTEGLNMIISGLSLQSGDEVIIATSDYPFAINSWKNRAIRDGIDVKSIDYQLPLSDDEIIEQYRSAITDKTRVLHLTHVKHREGHIMPIKRLTSLAHEYNIEVVVDGAHAVAQIPVDLRAYGCDYYASSLHKWLSAPLGTGLVYVKKSKQEYLQSYPSSYAGSKGTIDQFEQIGTRQWASEIAIGAALDFLDGITLREKTDRLHYLKKYWTDQLLDNSKIKFLTDLRPSHSCALSTFKINGMGGQQIVKLLNEQYHIHAKSVGSKWGSGVRISPNLFTSLTELDQLAHAINDISSRI